MLRWRRCARKPSPALYVESELLVERAGIAPNFLVRRDGYRRMGQLTPGQSTCSDAPNRSPHTLPNPPVKSRNYLA